MSASTIQFVSTNLTNRFEQIGVSVGVLKRSDGSRIRRIIPLPRNGAKSVDPLGLRQLWATKVNSIGARIESDNESIRFATRTEIVRSLDLVTVNGPRWNLGANSSAVKPVAKIVTQEYVTLFAL